MNKKCVQWLYGELPQWVAQGVLTSAAADRLRAHYGPVEPARPARLAVVVFGIFGALLIGAGVILMLAHNWEQLSRPMRASLSFLPLVVAQGLAAWALVRRPTSLAWREGVSALVFLMIGASISLVAQTYNISGDLPRFLLTWSLLGLPLVFLFDALVPALLYLWGISEWACCQRFDGDAGFAAAYWVLAALLLPQLARWLRAGRYQVRPTLLLWAVCVSVTVAAGVTVEHVVPGLWIILYAGLFSLMLLVGEFWFNGVDGFWSRPLRHFGSAGVLVLAFVLTFKEPWREVGWYHWRDVHSQFVLWRAVSDGIISGLLPLCALILLAMTVRRRTPLGLILGSIPIVATVGYSISSLTETHATSAGLFDLYLFAVGLWLLVTGMRIAKQGQMNVGLLVLMALVLARFFDSDLSFLLRGLVFIALGIAFLVANVVILRRKGDAHENA